jgi:RNA polymerase sigma-70 factor (ECF subfamily)
VTAIVTERSDLAAIVERTRAGSADALAVLYGRYAVAVYRIAYGLTQSRADAEDVVQDLFLGLPRALRSYRGEGSLEGWIRQIAVRTALMRLRSGKRRREDPLEAAPESSGSHSQPAPVEHIALERALALLPESLRVVFVLKVVEGYEHEEIAELLAITPELSRVRLFRARRELRQLLS